MREDEASCHVIRNVAFLVLAVGCGGKLAPDVDVADSALEDVVVQADAGNACTPFDAASLPMGDASAVGCFAGTLTINGMTACSSDKYELTCTGNVPTQPIPRPPETAECSAVPIPTPENVLFYCCRCAF